MPSSTHEPMSYIQVREIRVQRVLLNLCLPVSGPLLACTKPSTLFEANACITSNICLRTTDCQQKLTAHRFRLLICFSQLWIWSESVSAMTMRLEASFLSAGPRLGFFFLQTSRRFKHYPWLWPVFYLRYLVWVFFLFRQVVISNKEVVKNDGGCCSTLQGGSPESSWLLFQTGRCLTKQNDKKKPKRGSKVRNLAILHIQKKKKKKRIS